MFSSLPARPPGPTLFPYTTLFRSQEQAKQVYGDKMMLTPDLWKQFIQMQAPAMQGMLGSYLEQSAKLFMDMQQRMQDQTRGMFSAFPFPAFTATPQGGADDEKKR